MIKEVAREAAGLMRRVHVVEVIQGGIVGTRFQGAGYRTGETQLDQRRVRW